MNSRFLRSAQDGQSTSGLRAVDTHYKGYKFRSRLEARWAVFFETLGLKWEYEPEGFDLGGVWYLPDFRVMTPQGQPIWYEVKPQGVTSDEKFSLFKESFADSEGPRAELLSGDPFGMLEQRNAPCARCGVFLSKIEWFPDDGGASFQCWSCDLETPCGGGHDEEPGFLGLPVRPHKGSIEIGLDAYDVLLRKLAAAAKGARSARFEHGAQG